MAFFKGLNLVMTINKNQINKIVITVTGNTTLSIPVYYLFEFKRKSSNVCYYCVSTIATNYGSRQLFNIEDKPTPNALNSQVDLPSGEYTYKVYQQTDPTNLDPINTTMCANFLRWLNRGILNVTKPITQPIQYKGSDNTNPVYEG